MLTQHIVPALNKRIKKVDKSTAQALLTSWTGIAIAILETLSPGVSIIKEPAIARELTPGMAGGHVWEQGLSCARWQARVTIEYEFGSFGSGDTISSALTVKQDGLSFRISSLAKCGSESTTVSISSTATESMHQSVVNIVENGFR